MTDSPTPEQQKQFTSAMFDLVADGYDNPSQRLFPFTADRLVAKLQPLPGHKVIDIATGTGHAAMVAAQAIGGSGRVHAIDLSEGMLNRAQQNIDKMQLPNIDLHVMDAEALEFRSQYFDMAMCVFGLFFLPDMLTGLKSWWRVLKPGGKLMFTSFSPAAFQPQTDIFREQIAEYGVNFPEERWKRLKEPKECQVLMQQAGFTDINIDTEQMGYHLAAVKDWWEIIWNSGFRGLVEQLSPEQRTQFQAAHMNKVSELVTDQGLWLDVEVHFVSGHKPA